MKFNQSQKKFIQQYSFKKNQFTRTFNGASIAVSASMASGWQQQFSSRIAGEDLVGAIRPKEFNHIKDEGLIGQLKQLL